MENVITLIATLTARPGKSDQLGQMLGRMVEPSRSEEGCITYNAHRSVADPDVWIMYENWRSKQDLDDHMQLPPFKDFMKLAQDVLAKEVDFNFVTLMSPLAD